MKQNSNKEAFLTFILKKKDLLKLCKRECFELSEALRAWQTVPMTNATDRNNKSPILVTYKKSYFNLDYLRNNCSFFYLLL